ncbi:MAG: Asp23/Gls24 family envelope stress response protein [Negativicutes bacterium]|nr:Asp23/Gls24 family envelope stress response protein [Negativicutes bacterium]
MEVIALIGSSGTGKSHRATMVAEENQAEAIIDDGLLIIRGKIIAGTSAKREDSRIKAVKRAIFVDENHAKQIKIGLKEEQVQRLLILGTSKRMIERITEVLDIPPVSRWITITDIASEEEINKAQHLRNREGKHIVPVPAIELKPHFSGYLIDSLQVLFRRKFRHMTDKSIVRPKFSYYGKLVIGDGAIEQLARYVAEKESGVVKASVSQISNHENPIEKTIQIRVQLSAKHGILLVPLCKVVRDNVKQEIEHMTGMTVQKVDVSIKNLVVDNQKT